MKKALFLALLVLSPFYVSAQLKVLSSGKVNISSNLENVYAKLNVGATQTPFMSTYKMGLYVQGPGNPTGNNIGIAAKSTFPYTFPPQNLSPTWNAIGILGTAGGGINGYNYGVLGSLGSNNGAGIFGTSTGSFVAVPGQYAGYFYGDTYVNGVFSATTIINPSDSRLKTDVELLSNRGGILDGITKMNVISYRYKERETIEEAIDSTEAPKGKELEKRLSSIRHYGLFAQELQELFPDLVYEGQDGYLGVNYVELVPVLVRAIQELKQQIDELQDGDTAKRSIAKSSTTGLVNAMVKKNALYQNIPNPAKEQTVIRYHLADDAHDAAICIFDMQGKMLKKLPVSSDNGRVNINGNELGQGMFLYSLIVSGQEIDTKKMIITK